MIVMEFIEGKTIQESLSKTSPLNIYNLIQSMMETIHQNNYVHGDFRPTNIILTKESKPYLIDFDWSGKEGDVCYPFFLNEFLQNCGDIDSQPITKDNERKLFSKCE